MEDHPEIGLGNVQNLTDLPGVLPLDLPEGEGVRMVRRKPGEAFRELIEEFLFPVEVRRVAAPVDRPGGPVSRPVEGGGIGLFPEVAVLQGASRAWCR